MLKTKYLIYALQDPVTYEIRYIGLSSIGLKRIGQHTQSARLAKDKSYKANWIRSLLKQGLSPIPVVIQYLPNRLDTIECEKYWIKYFKDNGTRLTNLTVGGDGATGYIWKENDIRKSRPHPMQGKKLTDEQKAEVSRLTKLAMQDPEIREKCRKGGLGKPSWNTGKKMSKEYCENMSKARLGKHNPKKRKPIIDQNGTVYESVTNASKSLNISRSLISLVLTGKIKTANGFNFKYLTHKNLQYTYKKQTPLKDQFGNIYRSTRDASRKLNIDNTTLRKCLKEHKSVNGFSLEKI